MALLESDLTKVDQRIAEARARLARQAEIVRKLTRGGHDTSNAKALATIMQWTLKILEEDRRLIEDELLDAKAPWG
jgi:hypothetical protein